VLPDVEVYSQEFKERLSDELERLPPQDCPRDFVIPDCTALGTFTLDYIHLIDKIKSAVDTD